MIGCQVFVVHSLRSLSALEKIQNEGDEELGDPQTSDSRRVIVGERSEQALVPVRFSEPELNDSGGDPETYFFPQTFLLSTNSQAISQAKTISSFWAVLVDYCF